MEEKVINEEKVVTIQREEHLRVGRKSVEPWNRADMEAAANGDPLRAQKQLLQLSGRL